MPCEPRSGGPPVPDRAPILAGMAREFRLLSKPGMHGCTRSVKELPAWATVTAAGTGGLAYWLVIYPVDQVPAQSAHGLLAVMQGFWRCVLSGAHQDLYLTWRCNPVGQVKSALMCDSLVASERVYPNMATAFQARTTPPAQGLLVVAPPPAVQDTASCMGKELACTAVCFDRAGLHPRHVEWNGPINLLTGMHRCPRSGGHRLSGIGCLGGDPSSHALQKLYAEGGVTRFYKGFTPCLLRAFPANGIMLLTVDSVNNMLSK